MWRGELHTQVYPDSLHLTLSQVGSPLYGDFIFFSRGRIHTCQTTAHKSKPGAKPDMESRSPYGVPNRKIRAFWCPPESTSPLG